MSASQSKKEDLEKQILMLSSMVAEMSTEQEQLQAERDRLGEVVGSLHALQPAVPVNVRPQVTGCRSEAIDKCMQWTVVLALIQV